MIDWPQQLTNDIARRKAVLFLGAGVSKNAKSEAGSRPPDWKEFLRSGVSRVKGHKAHIQELINKGDLLTACEIIKKKLGDDWHDLLSEQFVIPRFRYSTIHKLLFALDLRFCLTQNFDKVYDTYAQSVSDNTITVKNYYDSDFSGSLRRQRPIIIKAHGTIDRPDRMIFTRSEYAHAREKYPAFYACIDALLLTQTFIFFGCSLADPDVQLFLERYNFLHGDCPPHYIVLPKEGLSNDILDVFRSTYNLKVLKYSGTRDHQDLIESTRDLVERVEPLRNRIADTKEW